jgi:hypothetical protein
VLTPAQLSMLCEGIDQRSPIRTDAPRLAGWLNICLFGEIEFDRVRRIRL